MTYQLLAATGCPTGIAHTYMAQEALEQAAKAAGVSIKVETHGQIGVENAFTVDEIAQAQAIIVAADKDVNIERFAGKHVIQVSVGKGIKDAPQLIADALDGKGAILTSQHTASQTAHEEQSKTYQSKESFGRQIYKHLMNGVSHMLPFVVGGGVLIAISFLWGIYSADPKHEQYNETAAMLMKIGQTAMGLMVPVLSAYIAESIAKRPGLVVGFVGGMLASSTGSGFLGGIVAGFLAGSIIYVLAKVCQFLPKSLDGLKVIFLYPVIGVLMIGVIMLATADPITAINKAMMSFLASFQNANPLVLGLIVGCMCAFDMGGPVNKAAYVTGTALLGQGNFLFMAGVSAACIAPPLMTTVAVTLFGKYYSKEDRNAGFVNFILGCTHITEGAIPFAAQNPLKNLPILMIGSSIAATLTYVFHVQVPAPHGGFLVLPVVTNGLLWVVAIAVGSLIGGVLLGLVKKMDVQKG